MVVADVADGDDAVTAIVDDGGEAAFVATDVTDDDSVAAAVAFTVETFGGLHVLYNNAGISPADDDGPTNTSDETWSRTLDVNVTGIARCCRHGIPAMLARAAAASSTSRRSSPTWERRRRRSPTPPRKERSWR